MQSPRLNFITISVTNVKLGGCNQDENLFCKDFRGDALTQLLHLATLHAFMMALNTVIDIMK